MVYKYTVYTATSSDRISIILIILACLVIKDYSDFTILQGLVQDRVGKPKNPPEKLAQKTPGISNKKPH